MDKNVHAFVYRCIYTHTCALRYSAFMREKVTWLSVSLSVHLHCITSENLKVLICIVASQDGTTEQDISPMCLNPDPLL